MALIGEMRYLQIGGNTYEIPTSELPIASSSTLGGIKVGTNLSIDSSTGVLSVTGIPTKISDITTHNNFGIGYIDCSSSDRNIFVSNVSFSTYGSSDYSSSFLLMFQGGVSGSTVTIPGSGSFHFYDINTNRLLNYQTSVHYTNLQYGKLYIAYMSDNVLTIKSIAETTDIPTIPTNISVFTNDAGYITGSDIPVTSVNGNTGAITVVEDDHKWGGVTLGGTGANTAANAYVPVKDSIGNTSGTASWATVTSTPTMYCIAKYDGGPYLYSTTPSSDDNSTKVATTAYVDAAIPTISINQQLTNGTKSATININGTDYDIYSETNTDTKVTQIPLNGMDSFKGLLFSNLTGSTQTTDTVYTSDKIIYSDYDQTLFIYNSNKTKSGYYKFDSIALANSTTLYSGLLKTANVTANRTYTLPNATGTIALTTDIPTVSITQNLTSGTKSATINISGTDYDIYSETNTDTKVTQIPLNGVNSNRGLLFASSVGSTQYTDTAYTSNKIWYNDYDQRLSIYDSSKTKYGYFKYDSLSLATNSYRGTLRVGSITASRTYTLPDATGTIALTSDIPSIPVTSVNGQTGAVTVTDQNVTQTAAETSTSAEYRILLSNSANDTTETNGVLKAGKLVYNPFNNQLTLYQNTQFAPVLKMYYRDGFYFNLQPYGYQGDSSNYNAIVAFTSGNGKDVVLRGIKVPSNDNDATNKLYVDTRSLPTGGTAGQFLVKSSSTNYDAAWVTVPSANGVSF